MMSLEQQRLQMFSIIDRPDIWYLINARHGSFTLLTYFIKALIFSCCLTPGAVCSTTHSLSLQQGFTIIRVDVAIPERSGHSTPQLGSFFNHSRDVISWGGSERWSSLMGLEDWSVQLVFQNCDFFFFFSFRLWPRAGHHRPSGQESRTLHLWLCGHVPRCCSQVHTHTRCGCSTNTAWFYLKCHKCAFVLDLCSFKFALKQHISLKDFPLFRLTHSSRLNSTVIDLLVRIRTDLSRRSLFLSLLMSFADINHPLCCTHWGSEGESFRTF